MYVMLESIQVFVSFLPVDLSYYSFTVVVTTAHRLNTH